MTRLSRTTRSMAWIGLGPVLAALAALSALGSSACIIGPKHEDPESLGAPTRDTGVASDGSFAPDTTPPPADNGVADTSPLPPDVSSADGGPCPDGGDAGCADAAPDAGDSGDASDAGDAVDAGESGDATVGDGVTGG